MAIEKTVTPKGELEWVIITGDGKENLNGQMQYVANLVLDPDNVPEHAAYIEKIKAYWEENKPKGMKEPKSLGIYPHKVKTDETDDEGKPVYAEDGRTNLAFKTGTTFPDGSPKVVKTFNSKAKEVQLGDTKIGNGSVGQISGAMNVYEVKGPKNKLIDAGVTLYLDAIKISKLVEFSTDAGFAADDDEEDEGFVGDEGWTGEDPATGSNDTAAKPRL